MPVAEAPTLGPVLTGRGARELANLLAGLARYAGPVSGLSWDLQPRYTGLLGVEGRGEMEELMEELLGDLVDEVRVLILLLYLWLERGVEFLSAVLGDSE